MYSMIIKTALVMELKAVCEKINKIFGTKFHVPEKVLNLAGYKKIDPADIPEDILAASKMK